MLNNLGHILGIIILALFIIFLITANRTLGRILLVIWIIMGIYSIFARRWLFLIIWILATYKGVTYNNR